MAAPIERESVASGNAARAAAEVAAPCGTESPREGVRRVAWSVGVEGNPVSQRKELFRTEADLAEAQAALLAWRDIGDGDARVDRLRDHTIALCNSLRIALRERDALAVRVTDLEAALRPFAVYAVHYDWKLGDHEPPDAAIFSDDVPWTVGDLRRARAALP